MTPPAKSPKIELDIQYHVEAPSDRQRINAAARWVAEQYGLARLQASVAIVDDVTIHQLNKQHLDHDWPTDVISFVFEYDDQANSVEGEVIASIDTATRLSEKAQWRPVDELLLYILHGFLHLAGLDDIEPDDKQEMRLAERDCLLALGVSSAVDYLNRFDDVAY